MPIRIPAAAYSIMFTDAVSVTAFSRATGSLAEATVDVPGASVSDASTDPVQVGAAPDAWRWTVEFPAASWTADLPPAPGATIAAGDRWPALYVQEAYPLGEIWHLVCSSREAPQ